MHEGGDRCSGTVYAVKCEVDNTRNRSEPLRGITHAQLPYQNRLVCFVVIKVLCSRFYSYQILLQKWWRIHFKYKYLILSKIFKALLPVSAKLSKVQLTQSNNNLPCCKLTLPASTSQANSADTTSGSNNQHLLTLRFFFFLNFLLFLQT